jgi:hypothetical protein
LLGVACPQSLSSNSVNSTAARLQHSSDHFLNPCKPAQQSMQEHCSKQLQQTVIFCSADAVLAECSSASRVSGNPCMKFKQASRGQQSATPPDNMHHFCDPLLTAACAMHAQETQSQTCSALSTHRKHCGDDKHQHSKQQCWWVRSSFTA